MNFDLTPEIEIRTSRSGGKGGQNVNKVETRVEARINIENSSIFNDAQKQLLLQKLAKRLNKDHTLSVQCSEKRTQLENKVIAVKKLHTIIENAFKVVKPRKASRMPRAVKERITDSKKKRGELKSLRKKVL